MFNGIKKLFVKNSTTAQFGIAIRRQIGSYAIVDNNNSHTEIDEFYTDTNDNPSAWLKELLTKHSFSGRGYLVLSSSYYHSVQIEKPNLPNDEIAAALKWLIKDIVPIAPDNMIVDYTDANIVIAGSAKINVVCGDAGQLKKLTDCCKRKHIKLTGITTDEFAFANLLPVSEQPTLLLCQQPFEDVLLLIVQQGKIYLSRHLRGFSDIGGYSEQQLSAGICEALSLEIQKSMDYFERQLKQQPLTKVQVLFPVLHEDFIIEQLQVNSNIPVTKLSLAAPFEDKRHCAASVGAILELAKHEVEHD